MFRRKRKDTEAAEDHLPKAWAEGMEVAPEGTDFTMAGKVLIWLDQPPMAGWDNGPMVMGFVEHDDHIDRAMFTPLPVERDEEMADMIDSLRAMLAEELPRLDPDHTRPPLVTMALVVEAWAGKRERGDADPTRPGDHPDDVEARAVFAVTPGGGYTMATMLRGSKAIIQPRPGDEDQAILPGAPPGVIDALHRLIAAANG